MYLKRSQDRLSTVAQLTTKLANSAQLAQQGSVEHKVKSWPPLFEATLSGAKTHELRRAGDRDYRVGDRLLLQEYDPVTLTYTGRELSLVITYVTSSAFPCALSEGGLQPDYCILSIQKSADFERGAN